MPSVLFTKKDDRYVFSGPTPDTFNDYHRDHAQLLVRYMFLMTPDEQQRLMASQPAATSAPPSAPPAEKAAAAHARRKGGKAAHARSRSPSVSRSAHARKELRGPFTSDVRSPAVGDISARLPPGLPEINSSVIKLISISP
jgi:hypothetical protein